MVVVPSAPVDAGLPFAASSDLYRRSPGRTSKAGVPITLATSVLLPATSVSSKSSPVETSAMAPTTSCSHGLLVPSTLSPHTCCKPLSRRRMHAQSDRSSVRWDRWAECAVVDAADLRRQVVLQGFASQD